MEQGVGGDGVMKEQHRIIAEKALLSIFMVDTQAYTGDKLHRT